MAIDYDVDTILGWVSLGEDGKPHRPVNGTGWRARRKPMTLYPTEKRAEAYSPVGKAKPVFWIED